MAGIGGGFQWESSWRAIGAGSHTSAQGDFKKGKLNHGPVGLGFLLTGGYMATVEPLYCPSGSGMPSGLAKTAPATQPAPGGLAAWKFAGGMDANAMLYGEWDRTAASSSSTGGYNAILSHYAYRAIPMASFGPWHKYQDNTAFAVLPKAKPVVYARVGQPYFRTYRELGSRALVSDAWDKGQYHDARGVNWAAINESTDIGLSRQVCGMGFMAHRQSYNVLYGDGGVRAFGDAQETLAWHTQAQNAVTSGYELRCRASYLRGVMAVNLWYSKIAFFVTNQDGSKEFQHSGPGVWHELDAAGGVDVPLGG